tara:strand:- start:11 stop:205 length:195 start_codon:yes stop_codon:yes gene_type:complete
VGTKRKKFNKGDLVSWKDNLLGIKKYGIFMSTENPEGLLYANIIRSDSVAVRVPLCIVEKEVSI